MCVSVMHVMSAMHGYNMLFIIGYIYYIKPIAVNVAFGAPKIKFIASAENIILWDAL